jgi:CheY-like chemotaxis protein
MPKKAKILIIDDELNLRRTLAFILQQAGYLVVTAADGLDALRSLITGSFDLVFIDLQLPDVEGIRLADEIHKIYSHLPIIILTGHPMDETKTA